MPASDVDTHRDRLVGLVGDHDAEALLRGAGTVVGRPRRLRRAEGAGLRLGGAVLLATLRAVAGPRGGLGLARLGTLLGRRAAAVAATGARSGLALLGGEWGDRLGGRLLGGLRLGSRGGLLRAGGIRIHGGDLLFGRVGGLVSHG